MLLFEVKNQKLTRVDAVEPATDSQQYLKAKFTINDADWNGKAKTAYFRLGDAVYKALLNSNNECVVPSEVLIRSESRYAKTQGGKFFLSLVGEYSTVRITTNELQIDLNSSGYSDAQTPKNPTENEYQQILTQYANNEAAINEAKAECETARDDLVGVKNIFANAIKGNLSGAVVKADDVSPIEHNPVVKVHGKNYFDYTQMIFENRESVLVNNGNGSITVKTTSGSSAVGANVTLRQLAPALKTGKMYTLSFTSNGTDKYIYLSASQSGWNNKMARIVTESDLDSFVFLYASGIDTSATISDIQIEEGGTATEYEPYVEPSTMTVKRCGKNFWHSKDLTYPRTVSGVTIDYDEESQIYTFNGTSTSAGDLYVLPNNTHIMTINAGETWTLKVEVMGGNIDGVATSSGKISPLVNTADYTNTIHANTETLYVTKTYTETADIAKMYFYVYASGIVFNNFKCRIQFELSDKPTEFEKFKDMSGFTPSSDGTVEGITSLSPVMTILTDTEGAIVECEYIKDTNKVLQKIADALNITI